MNVQDTLTESLRNYPGLYETGGDVLHHLFCVIGNGYEWHNGELVSIFPSEPWEKDKRYAEYRQSMLNAFGEDEEGIKLAEEFALNRVAEELTVHQEAPERASIWEGRERSIYPQSNYAALMNIPDDITSDWREAANYMKQFAIVNGWVF